ncbi:DUF4129 domain-containing protein [Verrucosispora sp. WMMD703]|uniref:Protein-glutamine gamma-glutamyltransferase-like C-terminal domain-containing protein n=1 Tax=Micromonospora sediminimaris TaxID=547162 RepID=A0A9W5XJM6_9ACTN|nr:DUF4129 domain-containing protein [Micromonospora sediminimaris]GIJ33079.1 hypothetical protein Vse01_22270 [Micromonospora sediminimaris]SFD13777.1 protein of unknown function [Micromonospora sediminimaris]
MSISRWWTETTAALGDHLPLPLATLLLVLATALTATAWYTFPAWLPRRLPRLHRRRRTEGTARKPETPPVTVASPPSAGPVGTEVMADRLAAEGRYDEAVRERLRGMLHQLTDRRVVQVRPGMTVAEVVTEAGAHHPPAEPPLSAAAAIFSEVWYAQRPATAEHDHRMRDHAGRLGDLLAAAPPAKDDDR